MFKRALLPILLLATAGGVLAWLTYSPFWSSVRRIMSVSNVVHQDYVDPGKVTYDRLADAAIRGMLESLDPYSRYMNAEEYTDFQEVTEQHYVGIGVEIEELEEGVMVLTVFDRSPASDAGVLPGDRIVGVEGEDMSNSGVELVSDALRGPEGGSVSVEFYRTMSDETLTMELQRRSVDVFSVTDVSMYQEAVGYIRVTHFGERTTKEFAAALAELESQGMRGLVLDLRNNPGGLLRTSGDVAGMFLEADTLVCYTEGRQKIDREELRPSSKKISSVPLVVLINGQSASGAEIVAGALQDTHRAYLVGSKSFGKGSVQSIYSFPDGSGIRQTTALYYLPSGRSINGSGVVPDEVVDMSLEDSIRIATQRRYRDQMSAEEFEARFEFAPVLEDPQLQAALKYLRQSVAEPSDVEDPSLATYSEYKSALRA